MSLVNSLTSFASVPISFEGLMDWLGKSPETDPPVPSGGTKYSYSARMDHLKIKLREADMDLLEMHVSMYFIPTQHIKPA